MNLETNQNPNEPNENNTNNVNNVNGFNGDDNSNGGKIFMVGFFTILVIGAFYGGYKLSQRFVDSKTAEEEVLDNENVEVVENVDDLQTASLITAIPTGKGEAVFKVSGNGVLREIFIHNPFKDSWVQVYYGYRELSAESQEVIRVNLASIKYDKMKVRTLDEYFDEINQVVEVKENSLTEVNLNL